MPITTSHERKAIGIAAVILTTILDLEDGEAPSGILYAGLMAEGIGLDEYNLIIGALKRSDLLSEHGHVLRLTVRGRTAAKRIAGVTR